MKKKRLSGRGGLSLLRRKTAVIMKLNFIFIFLLSLNVSANVYSQESRVSLDLQNVSMEEFVQAVRKQTGVQFLYSSALMNQAGQVSVKVNKEMLADVLAKVFNHSGLEYEFQDEVVVIRQKSGILRDNPQPAGKKYTGKVLDVKGTPLPGVTVMMKGTTLGVSTNQNGEFQILVPESVNPILVFSFIGMKSREVQVKNTTPVTVTLEESAEILDDVVVTGIFNKPKESFTGAAVKVTREELKLSGNRSILKSLSNIDPSFVIVENNSAGSNPNALPEIRLRGVSSIPSVDQLQSSTRADLTTPLFILDGFEISLERMMDLNNDEIESITILKDASATAIYGSRGSNGVVVIVSVRPEKGKLKVNYNANMNLEIPDLESYNLMDAREKLQLEWEAGLYNNDVASEDDKLKKAYAQKLERVMAGVNTDWISLPVRTGVGHNHYLGIGGGDDAFRYNLGLAFNQVKGAMKGSDRQTLNGTVSVSYYSKKVNLSNSMSFGINNSENSPYRDFGIYAKLNPYWEPYDADGILVKQFETESTALFRQPVNNPLWDASLNSFSKAKYNSITNNTSIIFKPFAALQVDGRISFNKTFSENDAYTSPRASDYINYKNQLEKGKREYSATNSTGWSVGLTANFYKVWDKHVVSAGLNYEARENSSKNRSYSVIGFVNDEINSMGMSQHFEGERPGSSDKKSRSIGFTGTVNYTYDNRYYVDGSYRLDGGSSFGSDSRFAPFWSLGCGWTVSNEPLMKEYVSFISNLRLKYSYGVTGSMAFSPWQSQGTYRYMSSDYFYRGAFGAVIRGLENKDLKWQNTYQQNVGVDLGVFKNRISVSANYYRKLTDNSITDMALPLSNGFKSYTGNSGEILNIGFDLSLSFYILRNQEKQMSWSIVVGTSHNKNQLRKLSEAVKERMNESRAGQSKGLYYVYEEGQSVDAIYAVPTVGVDPSTGRMIYVYKDGTQSYKYDVNERVVCGDRMPKFDGRLSTSFNWKGLSLNAGFTIRTGGQKYNATYANKIENVNLSYNVDRRVLTERWKNPGDEAIFSGLNTNNPYITDRYIQDEKTFSCNNVNLTYNFRQKWVSSLGFDRLSVTASISNVFYLSTIKQERGTSYPFAIQPTFGLSCAF